MSFNSAAARSNFSCWHNICNNIYNTIRANLSSYLSHRTARTRILGCVYQHTISSLVAFISTLSHLWLCFSSSSGRVRLRDRPSLRSRAVPCKVARSPRLALRGGCCVLALADGSWSIGGYWPWYPGWLRRFVRLQGPRQPVAYYDRARVDSTSHDSCFPRLPPRVA